jgi:hypothetical protein
MTGGFHWNMHMRLGKIKIPHSLPNTPTQDEVVSLLDISDLNSVVSG